jgi:hypothetical protein
MPATEYPVFAPPDNLDVKIWRYMDFTKFVSMLENGGLYFSRAHKLGDPFEGSLPVEELNHRTTYFLQGNMQHVDMILAHARAHRRRVLVSCWHMNQHESAAMWKLYAKSNEAIAVCSSYRKLRDSLDASCFVGTVKYIDYDHDAISDTGLGNMFVPFVHKRLSFQHEAELRAVIREEFPTVLRDASAPEFLTCHTDASLMFDIDSEPPDGGKWKPVDLDYLIDEIRIAPDAPEWFRELVSQVVVRYQLAKSVRQSSLDRSPLF